ncbi:MAG: STAS domain-containing protein [Anaerolineales bacterium]|nr:STAS domain-containing protein [Anaerolineales bacterium]
MTGLLKITKTEGPVTVLYFEGTLDGQSETLAVEHVRTVQGAGARFLLIDLHGVDMVTSAGLRALHTIYKMFTPNEVMQAWQLEHPDETFKSPYVKFSRPSSGVHYVLSIAGFLQNIAMYPDLQDALNSFAK